MEHYASRHKSPNDFQIIRALLERRSMSVPSLESETEQLRALVLALATDHVPFFSPQAKKRTTIDVFVLAQLLNRYCEERRKGCSPRDARSNAKGTKELRDKLTGAEDRRIQNLLAQARVKFKPLVTVGADGSITPAGDFETRIWDQLTNAHSLNRNAHPTVEWSPEDPDSVVVIDPQITE